jgi:hypothetical protein
MEALHSDGLALAGLSRSQSVIDLTPGRGDPQLPN